MTTEEIENKITLTKEQIVIREKNITRITSELDEEKEELENLESELTELEGDLATLEEKELMEADEEADFSGVSGDR